MYDHILIPVALDHEGLLPNKMKMARRLLNEGGRITLLTVLENIPAFVAEMVTVKSENHLLDHIRERLEDFVSGEANVACDVTTGKAGVEIATYADSAGCDLIIVGSHKPGVQDYFLGSTAARVIRRAKCSCVVVREG